LSVSISSQIVDALGTGNYLPVTRCLAVVDEDLGLLADGVGVAAHLGERAAPHQPEVSEKKDEQESRQACLRSCPTGG